MLYALNETGKKVRAIPHGRAICPVCSDEMIAKCGEINIWHWAHRSKKNCDPWYGSETAWHLQWKSKFPDAWVESIVTRNGKSHIADVLLPNGTVIEFQHSPISPVEIQAREDFYQSVIWVFDVRDCEERIDFRDRDGYWTFRWRHTRKHIASAHRVYLDVNDKYLFLLVKMYPDTPCSGWGYWLDAKYLFARISIELDADAIQLYWDHQPITWR